jgi:hypothetical protein
MPPTMRTPSIFRKDFLLVRMYRTDVLYDIIHSYCIKKQTLNTKET